MNRRELLSLAALPVVAPAVGMLPKSSEPLKLWAEIICRKTGDVTRYYECLPKSVPADCYVRLWREQTVIAASF